jgi:N-carbamoylputrescine amidase
MKVKIALLQHACSADPAANLRKACALATSAIRRGARIVCTQELFRSQYFCQSEDYGKFALAESIPGPTTNRFSALARRHGVVVVASVFERRAPGLFHNTAVVIDADGSIAGIYRKMHIPDDPLYYEKFYFTPGDLGFRSFQTRDAAIGVLVCWDQWFPEGARLTALHGAELLFYPTAIGWHPSEKAEWGETQHGAWETMQRAHAIANGVFVAVTNRVGREGGLEFWGASFVADPFGLVLATCDRQRIAETRRNWPFLRDRRIDAYGGLLKRYLD